MRRPVRQQQRGKRNQFLQGECIGLIEGLALFADSYPFQTSRSCAPGGVTIAQMTTVVVRWLEQHPELGMKISEFLCFAPCMTRGPVNNALVRSMLKTRPLTHGDRQIAKIAQGT